MSWPSRVAQNGVTSAVPSRFVRARGVRHGGTSALTRAVAWGVLFGWVATTAACISVYAPRVRATGAHAAVSSASSDASCMGCHEAEAEASARLAKLSPHRRQHEMEKMMTGGGGASLVAQWMIDDTRSCASCHAPRWGQP